MTKKKLINHVAIVLDDSGSMMPLKHTVIRMFNEQVESLKRASRSNNQETRLSVFLFGGHVSCLQFDKPLDEVKPITDTYTASQGSTALIEGTMVTISDLKSISTRYGDHSFLIYVITDGQENVSPYRGPELKRTLNRLNDDWTVAVLVPNTYCEAKAIEYGFSKGNIQIWETTERGLEVSSAKMSDTHTAYMSFRSMGTKSTKTLFSLPTEISKTEIKKTLDPIPAKDYQTIPVRTYDDGKEIKEFVEKMTGEAYRVGSAYYQLTKPEKVQPYKMVAVVDKQTGQMFSGYNARKVMGLPIMDEVKVAPASYKNFDVFIQSHSTNRHLVANTHLVVFK